MTLEETTYDRGQNAATELAVSVYDRWEALEALKDEWNRLAARAPTREIFLTYDFLHAWEASRARDCSLRVVVARRGSEVAGIAPLMFTTRRLPGMTLRSLEFLGTPASDYSDFIYEDPSVIETLWKGVQGLLERVDLLYLREIREDSPTLDFLKHRNGILRGSETCWSTTLPPPGAPISEYIKRPGFRPRVVRHLERQGVLTLDFFHEAEDILQHLPILFEQHIGRWRELNKDSYFTRASFRELYKNLSRNLAADRNVLLGVMRLDGVPIASFLGMVYQETLSLYTIAFDVAYRKLYCGMVMIVKLMQSLRGLGVTQVDFGRGDEDFKRFFGDIQRSNYEFLRLQTLRAKIMMPLFLDARDWAMSHQRVKALIARLGYRGDMISSQIE